MPGRGGSPPERVLLAPPAAVAAAAPVTATTVVPLLALARRGILGALDQLLGLDERAVLVECDELQADASASLVDLLDDDVQDVSRLITSSM